MLRHDIRPTIHGRHQRILLLDDILIVRYLYRDIAAFENPLKDTFQLE